MKQRSGSPKRTEQKLSESVQQRLNTYTLAASAAGVSLLALVQPAEAKIVYTKANVTIGYGGVQIYNLDLNDDGVTDFSILTSTRSKYVSITHRLFAKTAHRNAIEASIWRSRGKTLGNFALALKRGTRIPTVGKQFHHDSAVLLSGIQVDGGTTSYIGSWYQAGNRYLGLRFRINATIHYGWARLRVQTNGSQLITGTLTGYAYETIPNKPIIAGKTKGPDVITVEPATLGHLARGASGSRLGAEQRRSRHRTSGF